jgi:ATP-dependent Clp protease, protease subunit
MSRKNSLREDVDTFFSNNLHIPTRTIYLAYGDQQDDDDVEKSLAANMIKALLILQHSSSEDPINILLNCQGGSVGHGLAIYDIIRSLTCPVHTTVTGHAYSMGAWILQAADVRRMTKHSSLMIHDGDSTVSGRSQDAKNWYTFYEQQDDVCVNILLERIREKNPNFPKAKLVKMLKQDTILWAPEALELGLIDEIVGE